MTTYPREHVGAPLTATPCVACAELAERALRADNLAAARLKTIRLLLALMFLVGIIVGIIVGLHK